MGLFDFPFRSAKVWEWYFYASNQCMQVPLAIRKSKKIEAQSTSINLKVIQKDKIKQTKLPLYLWISNT